jgi:GT2 family glycosyltransferase
MVTGLFLGRNTGFTGANNAGAAVSDSEFIVL